MLDCGRRWRAVEAPCGRPDAYSRLYAGLPSDRRAGDLRVGCGRGPGGLLWWPLDSYSVDGRRPQACWVVKAGKPVRPGHRNAQVHRLPKRLIGPLWAALVGVMAIRSVGLISASPPDGTGNFADSGQLLGSRSSADVALVDTNGDGDLDAAVANSSSASRIWVNDGTGSFSPGQALTAGPLSAAGGWARQSFPPSRTEGCAARAE